jgi:acetyl-CoA acyltransferase
MTFLENNHRSPVIVAGYRTPFLRSGTSYKHLRAYDLARIALHGLLDKTQIEPGQIQSVIFGTVLNQPNTSNIGREAMIGAALPSYIPAHTVTMACISGNQAITQSAQLIAGGQVDIAVAGGTECLSDIPILLGRPLRQKLTEFRSVKKPLDYMRWLAGLRPSDLLPETPKIEEFSTGLSMGQSADRLAARWAITREEQDQYALRSHQSAARATRQGVLNDEILITAVPPDFRPIKEDNGIREDTSLEKLSKLRPVFYPEYGTITAGNSSFLSDGAAAVLLMSKGRARELGYAPMARLVCSAYVGCDPLEELLLGPAYAVPKVLTDTGLQLREMDAFEFHEAFAGQILANLKALDSESFGRNNLGRSHKVGEVPLDRLNTLGGSLSLGHPFGATGIRLLSSCCRRLQRGDGKFGMIASCAAGGLGHALIVERIG